MKHFPYDLRTLSVAHKVANRIALTVADAEYAASRFADPSCDQMERRLLGGPDMEELTAPYRIPEPFVQSVQWKELLTVGAIDAPALDAYAFPELEVAIEKLLVGMANDVMASLDSLETLEAEEAQGDVEETKAKRVPHKVTLYDVDAHLLSSGALDNWIKSIVDGTKPILESFLRRVGLRSLIDVRVQADQSIIGAAFNLASDYVEQYLASSTHRIGRDAVTVGYMDEIRKALVAGIEEGEDTRRIKNRIERLTHRDIVGWRAERIARTEGAFGNHFGTVAGWKQSGVVAYKQFVLSAEPCEVCVAVAEELGRDGKRDTLKKVPLDDPFFPNPKVLQAKFTLADGSTKVREVTLDYAPDGKQLSIPPVHPNCRCSMRPVLT